MGRPCCCQQLHGPSLYVESLSKIARLTIYCQASLAVSRVIVLVFAAKPPQLVLPQFLFAEELGALR
jgi:hypothetical protein